MEEIDAFEKVEEIDDKVCESIEREVKEDFVPCFLGNKYENKEYDFDEEFCGEPLPDYDDAELMLQK